MDYTNIPDELTSRKQWINHRAKVPIVSKDIENSEHASTTNAKTWTLFRNAVLRQKKYQDVDGIGFVFGPERDLFGIDLDKCRDPETGVIEGWAQEVLDQFPTYAEISPSGTGIHIIGRGTLPEGTRRRGRVECYDHGRYFTVTGNVIPGHTEVADCSHILPEWHAEAFPPETEYVAPDLSAYNTTNDDDLIELLEKAANGDKFRALFGGDTSDYPSDSEADLALASLITFYSTDEEQVYRIIRRSALFDKKWERESYRKNTIREALKRSDHYTPPSGEWESVEVTIEIPAARVPTTEEAKEIIRYEFPTEVLPEPFKTFVEEGAASRSVPTDMIAGPLLSVVSAAIGNSYFIRAREGWEEYASLWVAIVGDPGTRKTSAINFARQPLDELQREAYRLYKDKLDLWKTQADAAKNAKPRQDFTEPQPVLEHFWTNDATMEALVLGLSTSSGMAIIQDELVGWIEAMDTYRKGGDRQKFLSLYSSVDIKNDRVEKGTTLVSKPVVSIIGGIQPDMMHKIHNEASNDGMFSRFLPLWPSVQPSPWEVATVTPGITDAVREVIRSIRYPRRGPLELETSLAITADPEAQAAFGQWFMDNERIIFSTEGVARQAYAKYPGQLAKLCMILHMMRHPDGSDLTLTVSTVRDGIELIEYFRAHLNRVLMRFKATGTPQTAGLQQRIIRIMSAKDQEWIPKSELHRDLHNHISAEQLSVTLDEMERAGITRQRTIPGKGRPRTEVQLANVPDLNDDEWEEF